MIEYEDTIHFQTKICKNAIIQYLSLSNINLNIRYEGIILDIILFFIIALSMIPFARFKLYFVFAIIILYKLIDLNKIRHYFVVLSIYFKIKLIKKNTKINIKRLAYYLLKYEFNETIYYIRNSGIMGDVDEKVSYNKFLTLISDVKNNDLRVLLRLYEDKTILYLYNYDVNFIELDLNDIS